ncbi:hypothetical protein CNECB9_350050 [Cupriavidus necator]|uniref:Uncharacterized protein n=1 Tax=Cupriavidus necator TaxID=106590 RepID=A0A1K0JGA1_CUPNE|nr:hypothetical protein CNECB9_350050 [Cupriavidus necator]
MRGRRGRLDAYHCRHHSTRHRNVNANVTNVANVANNADRGQQQRHAVGYHRSRARDR